MKKKITFLLSILIILNTILGVSSLAIETQNENPKTQTVEEILEEGIFQVADYNKLYGIEPLEEPQIKINPNAKAQTQKLKYIAVFISFAGTRPQNHLDDEQCIENAKTIFNSEGLFDMQTSGGTIKVPSLKKYYEMQSYGSLSIETEIFPKVDGEIVCYEDPQPMEYYLKYSAENPQGYKNETESLKRETELINNAVKAVSSQIQASGITKEQIDTGGDDIVDAISFFVEGYDVINSKVGWSDLLWSHKLDNQGITEKILDKRVVSYNLLYAYDYTDTAGLFSLNTGTYGTILHEFGHTLGYKDLYRFGDSSKGNPVGYYDLMGTTIGSNPQDLLTYFISEYYQETNWHSQMPTISGTTKSITLTKPNYIDKNEKRAVKIKPNTGSQEYFVVEYYEKKQVINSSTADASGIIVYRVNENRKFAGNADRRRPWRRRPHIYL